MPAPSRPVQYGVIALLTLLWGTTWAAIRIGLVGVPPFTGAAIRFVIGSALLLALAPVFRISFARSPHVVRLWLANGLLLFVGSYGVVYWAEQWVPSGLAAVLFATFPLFVALFAHFLVPGERLTRGVIGGVALGFAGVVVLYSEDLQALGGGRTALAAALFLVSPVCAALANVLVKRWGRGIHPVSKTVVPMMIGAVVLGALAAGFERDVPIRFDRASVLSIVYLAVFGTVITFVLYFWLMEHMSVTRLALIAYLTPIVALATGALWLGETITPRVLLGAAGVIGGVAIAGRMPGRARRVPRSSAPSGGERSK